MPVISKNPLGTHSGGALDDERKLKALGYEPRLTRRLSGFQNFAFSFSVISVPTGCLGMYLYGMNTGGPRVMMLGWIAVTVIVMCIAISLAEIVSKYPTAGGLYYMSERLGGRKWGWYTGWLNMLGLIGAVASIDFGAATITGMFLEMQWGISPSSNDIFLIFLGILLLHVAMNLFRAKVVAVLASVSAWWHLIGVAAIVVVLVVVPGEHQSPGFVVGHWNNDTGFPAFYVSLIGLLTAWYTFCGWDASAHVSEETVQSAMNSPRGMVRSVWVSGIAGFLLLGAVTFAMQNWGKAQGAESPPAQIFLDSLGMTGAKLLLLIVIGAQLFCGFAEVAACSRLVWSFSRDRAIPGSSLWARINRRNIPALAIVFTVFWAAVLASPALWSPTAYTAVVAINVVGFYPAVAIPIFLRVRNRKTFQTGDWHAKGWGVGLGVISLSSSSSAPRCSASRKPVPQAAACSRWRRSTTPLWLSDSGCSWRPSCGWGRAARTTAFPL